MGAQRVAGMLAVASAAALLALTVIASVTGQGWTIGTAGTAMGPAMMSGAAGPSMMSGGGMGGMMGGAMTGGGMMGPGMMGQGHMSVR